uniref:Uncharacterized protein n=1 Tax=Rhizophora mucronata TaxID=61149 RepID=A0A2P2NUB0_RHIMU
MQKILTIFLALFFHTCYVIEEKFDNRKIQSRTQNCVNSETKVFRERNFYSGQLISNIVIIVN